MHTPGPWRSVEICDDGYYTHQIEITGGHVASVSGWSSFGQVCETTAANARLIEHAPDLADAVSNLLAWNAFCGHWEAPCWRRANAVLRRATGCAPAMLLVWKLAARPLFDEIVPTEAGWTDQTKLSVLLDFLDTEIAGDFAVRDRLVRHLQDAIAA